MGFCPQANLLFDDLTVYEHVSLIAKVAICALRSFEMEFLQLKCSGKTSAVENKTIDILLGRCGLVSQRNTPVRLRNGNEKHLFP